MVDQAHASAGTSPADTLEKVLAGRSLEADEAEAAFTRFMDGSASQAEMAGLLVALRAKGVAPTEVAGGVRALRGAMVRVRHAEPSTLVDTAGTGGGSATTFNVSTAAALVAAGAGVPVAKHGNRSFTSRSGSADVLEALGVRIDLDADRMSEILSEIGIVFMFAPLLHPAMRHVGPVRRDLGVRTVMNILGPLTNPAGARRQVVGVADDALRSLIASALGELSHARALVVHGEAGLDELSPLGVTRVSELRDGRVREYTITPQALGLEDRPLEELRGGEPAENAEIIRSVLEGGGTPGARNATLMNAAAAIYVADDDGSVTLARALERARTSLDEGAAARALDALVRASNEAARGD